MARPGTRPGRPMLLGYSVAVLASAAATLGQHALEPVLDDRFPFALFAAGVALAAWAGGPGPGLLATALEGLAGAYFVLEPGSSLRAPIFAIGLPRPADSVALTLFVITGILISLSIRRLRRQANTDRDARQEAERLLRHTAQLQDLTSALSRANTINEVTHASVIELLHALGAHAGAFAVTDDDGGSYSYVTTVGAGDDGIVGVPIDLDARTPVADALRGRDLVIVENSDRGDAAHPDRARDPFSPPHRLAVVQPLARTGRAVGAIVLLFDRSHDIDEDERRFLSVAGTRIVPALERARLYEMTEKARAEAEDYREKADLELRERQRAEERLRESEAQYRSLAARTNRLYELSAGLSKAVTVAAVAKVIVRQGKIVVGASAGSVALLENGDMFRTLYAEDYPAVDAEAWARYPADPGLISSAAVATREPVMVSGFADLQKHYPRSAVLAADGGYASATALPLLVEDVVVGVLAFHFTAPVHFDAGYAKLLLSVAQHCAQALDRARLYESAQAARNIAEEANRSKDEFLSTVSHELRTPLNAMLGWASLLRNGTLDQSRSARAIEGVFNNATRQAHLIEELLDVSRIVAGRAPLDPEPLDIGDNIRGAVEAILPIAEAKGVEVAVDAPTGVTVVADPRRLEQVFLNILSNAVKFTPGGGRIRITHEVHGERVDLTVVDTGTGIEPGFLPHVFDRFRQADSSMARSVGGLGLGLFIARHLVEAQGGRISAMSEGRGRGSTFVVSLPTVAASPVGAAPLPAATDQSTRLSGIRVLLVDDDADARELMISTLEACGATVRAARSTAEALECLRDYTYDVLLSDLAMPGDDGYSLITAVRSAAAGSATIPAAAVTAAAGEDARQRALTAGFDLHVAKPVEPQALADAVVTLAGRTGATAPIAAPHAAPRAPLPQG